MSRDWTFYLEDILDSAKKVLRYSEGMTMDEFRRNEMVFDAVIRNLEIIGEAAKHLPVEIQQEMPGVEWAKAAAFRDVIAHHYFGLNIFVVWDIMQSKIPQIVSATEDLLRRAGGTGA